MRFRLPRQHGMSVAPTIDAMHRGDVKVFVSLGANFAPTTPDVPNIFEALT